MPTAPRFDETQFADRRVYPVSAEVTADGWQSKGLDFSDYARMGTQRRMPSGERRLPTPIWAIRNSLLQELLISFLEGRATCGFWRATKLRDDGDTSKRLERAKGILNHQRTAQSELLDRLCKEFVATDDPERKRILQREIESLDTLLRYTADDSGAAIIAAVVVLYYRVGMDSVGVGMELHMKPTHVRRMLWSLHRCATSISLEQTVTAKGEQTESIAFNHTRSLPKKVLRGYKAVYTYRNQPVTLVEDQGKLLKIRYEKGLPLCVEAKKVTVSYVKES
jgi:hypothetical protein